MKAMTSNEIRQSFLKFFESNGHRVVQSSSLIPENDSTLLFTNAGMNQFKELFLGKEHRDYKRAVSSQKCMRVSGKHNDLNNVGPSLRHHTFFEMLGNFSFGNYFKSDAIPLAWQLLTEVWKIPTNKLYATVFSGETRIPGDKEARNIWRKLLPDERISEFGLADNFWSMGDTGPCGPCSEIYYHRGDHLPCSEQICRGINCSCDRYIEIWNNVFMEFDRQDDGTLMPLPTPSIDTGMGLERIVAVLQETSSNYDTDLFTPLLERISELTKSLYVPFNNLQEDAPHNMSMRVLADHTRAMTFLIADGVLPSNEWRGYVLRKIMRRAMQHGKKLGMTEPFLYKLTEPVITQMEMTYPELLTSRDTITKVIHREEKRFDSMLNDGSVRLEKVIEEAGLRNNIVNGDEAFKLYDTYGLPFDFIKDIVDERGLKLDRKGFDQALERQRRKSRTGQTFEQTQDLDFYFNSDETEKDLKQIADNFDGYLVTTLPDIKILALFDEKRKQVDTLKDEAKGYALLERTPFYIEAGGQVSDEGQIVSKSDSGRATVEEMSRLSSHGPRVHMIRIASGQLKSGETVTASVDNHKRTATRRNHTATHLLHAALRKILGNHVNQAGSLVSPERLRFDFTHFEPLSPKQLTDIEKMVNTQIYTNRLVETEVISKNEATAKGAIALFGEKYGDLVRVVSVPGVSMELCGGTHCHATGDIGPFIINQEFGISAGIRRIEALTGETAVNSFQTNNNLLDQILSVLTVKRETAVATVEQLQKHDKRLAREIETLKVQTAVGNALDMSEKDVSEINGVKILTRHVSGLGKAELRALADSLRDHLESGIVILASDKKENVFLLVSVTKDLYGLLHAGNIVKSLAPMIGGKGGGRHDFAEAGGRHKDKIDHLFSESRLLINRLLEESKQ